jgi:hypothetical protein
VNHDMNRQIIDVLGGTAALGSDVKRGLTGKIWRRIKSKIDAFSEKPENTPEREGPKRGEP